MEKAVWNGKLFLASDVAEDFQLENKIQQVTKESLYEAIDILMTNNEQWYYLTGVK